MALVDGDPVVLEGDSSLIVNFGASRVVIGKADGAAEGTFEVTIIEDGEGTMETTWLDRTHGLRAHRQEGR